MDQLSQIPFTLCAIKVALTATGAATTVGSTGTVHYCIKGKAYTTSAASSSATPTTDATTAAAFVAVPINYGCVYVLGLDGSSATFATALKVSQGALVALDSAGSFVLAPQFPAFPDTVCPVAYIVVKNGATGSAWTFGTSNWNATGITLGIQDVMTLTGRPQVS
jgi:hypothetical protein